MCGCDAAFLSNCFDHLLLLLCCCRSTHESSSLLVIVLLGEQKKAGSISGEEGAGSRREGVLIDR